jgi:hypothetical protein
MTRSLFPGALDDHKLPASSSLVIPDAILGELEICRDIGQAAQAKIGADPAGLWLGAPMMRVLTDPTYAYYFFDDFSYVQKSSEAWILTQATTGTAVKSGQSLLTMNAGAATDGQGPQMQLAGLDLKPAANKHIWFEVRLKDSFITGDFFFGLANLDTTLIASSAVTMTDYIGFASFTGDGVLDLVTSSASGTQGITAGVKTLGAATFVRLGFYVDGLTSVTPYIDGVAGTPMAIAARIPIVGLTPSLTVHATGTNQDVVDVDWVRALQLR